MNTQQLECFTTLAKTLNYARTAEQVGLSQPAVSRQIQSLESELQARLFARTTRSVTLTPTGQQFLPDAQQILAIYYHAKEGIASQHRTVLRIGYADSHANHLISEILRPVLQKSPHIVPELTLDQTDANLHRLSVNQLDLIVGIKDARFQDEAITFQALYEDTFVCIVSQSHPLARQCQKAVSTADFWPYRQIIAIPPYLMKRAFSHGHRCIPINDALDNIVCATTSEAYNLALAGAGFALIPHHLAMPHAGLAFLPWQESPKAPLGIYFRTQSLAAPDAALGQFMEQAKKIAAHQADA